MKRTETPKRYGRRAPMKADRNVALPAVPAASTNGSTGRQQVAAARTLPTAESAAASASFEEGFPAFLIVSVFIGCSFPPPEGLGRPTLAYRQSTRETVPTPITTN